MLDDVYNARILGLAAEVERRGRLENAEGSASLRAKLCGSTVTVDVRLDANRIADFATEVRACALGQASSAIMARHVIGTSVEDLRAIRDGVSRMLKEGAPPPVIEGWPELAWLEPVKDFKSRHASTLLTFDATLAAAEEAMLKRAVSAA